MSNKKEQIAESNRLMVLLAKKSGAIKEFIDGNHQSSDQYWEKLSELQREMWMAHSCWQEYAHKHFGDN